MKNSKKLFNKFFLISFTVHFLIISLVVYFIYEVEAEINRPAIEIGYIDSPSGDKKDLVEKKNRSQKVARKRIENEIKPELSEKNVKPKKNKTEKLKVENNLSQSEVKVVEADKKSPSIKPSPISYNSDNSNKNSNLIVARPDYKFNPKPDYPIIAKRRGYEGMVLLNVYVLESGRVGELNMEKASGHSVLDKSAIDSVKQWIFVPGKRNGNAVSSWVQVPIKFQLTNI